MMHEGIKEDVYLADSWGIFLQQFLVVKYGDSIQIRMARAQNTLAPRAGH